MSPGKISVGILVGGVLCAAVAFYTWRAPAGPTTKGPVGTPAEALSPAAPRAYVADMESLALAQRVPKEGVTMRISGPAFPALGGKVREVRNESACNMTLAAIAKMERSAPKGHVRIDDLPPVAPPLSLATTSRIEFIWKDAGGVKRTAWFAFDLERTQLEPGKLYDLLDSLSKTFGLGFQPPVSGDR